MCMQDIDKAQAAQTANVSQGDICTTARLTTALADSSNELKQYLGLNSALLERYSHELLHVQSLAAQMVQMSSMKPL